MQYAGGTAANVTTRQHISNTDGVWTTCFPDFSVYHIEVGASYGPAQLQSEGMHFLHSSMQL